MEIIRDIEQGSDDWHKLRLGIPTASNFKKIVTKSGKLSKSIEEYATKLAAQSLMTSLPPDCESYKSEYMNRGTELEGDARECYEQETLNSVEQVSFIKNFGAGYSPDGLIGNDGILEIKCPSSWKHIEYKSKNAIPCEYYAQCQGGLLISEREWCDFVSYHNSFDDKGMFFCVRTYRNEKFIKNLMAGIEKILSMRDSIIEQYRGNCNES